MCCHPSCRSQDDLDLFIKEIELMRKLRHRCGLYTKRRSEPVSAAGSCTICVMLSGRGLKPKMFAEVRSIAAQHLDLLQHAGCA
jgi:hypothetical protein